MVFMLFSGATLFSLAFVVKSAVAATLPLVIRKEIVVTAARDLQPRDQASAAVTVLDRQELGQLPVSSLAEVLTFVPGVTMMFDSGSDGLPMITSRGFFGGGEVEYVKLIVDGVPVGDAESGNTDWQSIRTHDIERIEVLHGPGSALYGDTALGGVIQIFTSPAPTDSDGDVHSNAGSFGSRELGATYRTDLASGLRLDASAGNWSTDGFRANAGADGRHGRLTLERLGDRWRWRVDGEAERQHRQQPGALTRTAIAENREQSDDLFRFDGQTTTRDRIGAALDFFGRAPVHATLYDLRRDDDNLRTLLLAPGYGSSAFRALTTGAGGGTLEASREWAGGIVRAGADLERASISASYAPVRENGQTGATVGAEDGRRDRVGLFVTGGWTLGPRYHVSAGVRRDDIRDDLTSTTTGGPRHKGTSSAWSPRVGLNVHLGAVDSPLSLFAQMSSAFKAPTLDQLFDPRPYPDGTGGTFTISNPGLRPQRARNLEVGLARTTAGIDWSLVAYRMNVRDEIDFDPRTFSYRNIGRSLHRGIEASATFAKSSRISPRVTYAWTRVADSATPELQLKNIPEHTAQLLLRCRVTAKTSADIGYRWRDSLSLDDGGMFRAPSFSRIDLRLAHDVRNLRLQADILNALDAHYNELGYVLFGFTGQPAALEYPAPGRALRLGVTWTFRKKENER
jgi:outer membrane cobalamin receptor